MAMQSHELAAKACSTQKADWTYLTSMPNNQSQLVRLTLGKRFFEDQVRLELLAYLCTLAELMGFCMTLSLLEEAWSRVAVGGSRRYPQAPEEEMASEYGHLCGMFSEVRSWDLGRPMYLSGMSLSSESFKCHLHTYIAVMECIPDAVMGLVFSELASVLWLVEFLMTLDMGFREDAEERLVASLELTLNHKFS